MSCGILWVFVFSESRCRLDPINININIQRHFEIQDGSIRFWNDHEILSIVKYLKMWVFKKRSPVQRSMFGTVFKSKMSASGFRKTEGNPDSSQF